MNCPYNMIPTIECLDEPAVALVCDEVDQTYEYPFKFKNNLDRCVSISSFDSLC